MTTRVKVDIALGDRRVEFTMLTDAGNIADHHTMLAIEQDGCCEPEVAHVMRRVIREGDHVVDVGASIGFFTLLLAHLVGLKGSVTAFEPSAAPFFKLRENVKANRLSHVSCMQQALWERCEEVILHQCQDSGQNSLARNPSSVGKAKIAATTYDRAMTSPKARLLKIDVEGAEQNVLYGAKGLVPANVPYILSEINDEALERFGHSSQSYRQAMAQRGYDTFLIHRNGALPALMPPQTKLVQGLHQNVNVLFSTLEFVAEAWPEVTV